MKRWLYYLGTVAAVAALSAEPSAGSDIGKLQPVQVVCITVSDGQVTVRTDTEDRGTGETLAAAVSNMQETATGEVFLETADHLLLAPDCQFLLRDVMTLLRPSCSLCWMEGEPEMEDIGLFLQIHAPETTLKDYRAGIRSVQTLRTQNGRMQLVS